MSAHNIYDSLDYFKILNSTPTTPDEELRQNYRELAKFWHPDHNKDSKAVDMFQQISVAYDVLKDPMIRLKYILLSIIYDKNDFPDMNAICPLRNMHGQEDLNLRAFHLIEVTGKCFTHNKIDKVYLCSQYEAASVIAGITKHNWLLGFWGLTAFFVNIVALIQNILRINNKKDNLSLLVHNALAYDMLGKKEEAITLFSLAREYADFDELTYINEYAKHLNSYTPMITKRWNFSKLKRIQLFYPLTFLFCILLILGGLFLRNYSLTKQGEVNLNQVVVFKDGQKTYSDIAAAKIISIPVDIYDRTRLYHVTEQTQAMHGADKNFDVYKTVEAETTVRLTGYTADKKWYRVMFNNGEMAFIESNKLEQGIGKEIPLWSKIFKEE